MEVSLNLHALSCACLVELPNCLDGRCTSCGVCCGDPLELLETQTSTYFDHDWLRAWQGEALFVRARSCLSCPRYLKLPRQRYDTRLGKEWPEVFPGVMGLSDSLLSCTAQDTWDKIKARYEKLRAEKKSGKKTQGATMKYDSLILRNQARPGAWKQCDVQRLPQIGM